MHAIWGLVASNAIVATLLALGALLLGRSWKDAAAVHGLWVVVLLKLFTPPLLIAGLPFAFAGSTPAEGAGSREKAPSSRSTRESGASATIAKANPIGPLVADDPRLGLQGRPSGSATPESWSLSAILAIIWVGGACGMAAVYFVGVRRFARVLGESEGAPPAILAMVAEVSSRLGPGRVPEVRMTSRALPPLVWSIGTAPRILLPSRLFARLGDEAQRTILAHELIHIRRGDHLVRLLELAATTVFWWHPVAWLAGRRLRELEEECCDGRVLELLPDRPRTYAAALVDTLEFLSRGAVPPLPFGTAIDPAHSLSRRISMLTRRRTNRLSGSSAAIVLGLAAFPLALAFADRPEQATKAAPDTQAPAVAPIATLKGRVTTKSGTPLPGARVRVAVPAIDMRNVDPSSDHPLMEVKADANGDYQMKIPGIAGRTTISIDAMMPGFLRLSGTLMAGADPRRVDLDPGSVAEANLPLEPSRYFSGVVVNDQGKPIPAAQVISTFAFKRGMAFVEVTASGPDGSFELFNYPLDPARMLGDDASKGTVTFEHPDHIGSKIDDVYAIEPARRGELRVVMPTGRKVEGTVLDAEGKPVAKAMVEADSKAGGHRKATLTDADGKFALRGLEAGPSTLIALAKGIKQNARLPLELEGDKLGLEVRLRPIALPADLKTHAVLGMQLADMTAKLKAAYDISNARGAVILDPGPNFDRLNIGELAEGYCFWLVGETQVGSVREFVDQILAEVGGRDAEDCSIRVVYSFKTPEFVGTNTQHLKITKDDVKQLQAASDGFKAEVK